MKTAIEWFVGYLKNIKVKELSFIRQDLNIHEQNILNDIIEQAKEMEKQRLKDAYTMGREGKTIAEFNETFKSE